MDSYFARDYSGGAFVLFGPQHLIGLALVAAVCGLIFLFRKRFNAPQRSAARWGLLALIYLCEGSWQVWMLATGQWTIQGMLPLWLCSLTSWSMPLLLIWRSHRYYEWAYFMGIIGASMALLTPDLDELRVSPFSLYRILYPARRHYRRGGVYDGGGRLPAYLVIAAAGDPDHQPVLAVLRLGQQPDRQQLSLHPGQTAHAQPAGRARPAPLVPAGDGGAGHLAAPADVPAVCAA